MSVTNLAANVIPTDDLARGVDVGGSCFGGSCGGNRRVTAAMAGRRPQPALARRARRDPPDIAASRIVDHLMLSGRRRAANDPAIGVIGRCGLAIDECAAGDATTSIVERDRALAVGLGPAEALAAGVVECALLCRGSGRQSGERQRSDDGRFGHRAHPGDRSRRGVVQACYFAPNICSSLPWWLAAECLVQRGRLTEPPRGRRRYRNGKIAALKACT